MGRAHRSMTVAISAFFIFKVATQLDLFRVRKTYSERNVGAAGRSFSFRQVGISSEVTLVLCCFFCFSLKPVINAWLRRNYRYQPIFFSDWICSEIIFRLLRVGTNCSMPSQ